MTMNQALLTSAVLLAMQVNAEQFNGKLVDHSGKPLANASVEVRGQAIKARSNSDGAFTLELPQGDYTLDIEAGAKGHFHQSISVTESEDLQLVHIDVNHANKVVITANPLEHTKLDMAAPAIVLSGEELTLKRSANLGEILQMEPGMSMSSFGPSVSRPVIRGLSGGRVVITNNQMTVQDASTTSADHDVSLEPLLAEQIEVLKGPATLLYGSGAIGGVVNVKDGKINPNGALETTGGIEVRLGDSTTGEQSLVGVLNGGSANFAWHLDFFDNQFDDIKIPGHAESEILHQAEGHEEVAEGEEEHGGVLENSRSNSSGASIGTTWNGEWGYFGAAVSRIEKLYGVPGHAHHEEEPTTPPAEPEEEHSGVFIDLEQTRYDLQAGINQPFAGFKEWFIGVAYTDYQHVELEGDEIGTTFDNEAIELRTYLQHNPADGWDGILGFQFTDRDFSALGEEAFVPPSVTQSISIFAVEEKRFGDIKLELGARLDRQSVEAEGFNDKSETTFSFSSGMVYDLTDNIKFAINFAHAERAATVEELYSFGEHAATQTFEIGNPSLDTEKSNNLDVSFRFEFESIQGEINGYWNQFDGFIYGANEENTGTVLDFNGSPVTVEPDLPIIRYLQQDAAIRGVEINLNFPLVQHNGYGLDLTFLADFIEAELDSGDYLPRMPSLKYGAGLKFDHDNFFADLTVINYEDQYKTASNELPTEGFTMIDLELAYRLTTNNSDTLIFLRGRNLLDEEARDHTSYLKDLAPRAGRSFVAGIRYNF